MSHQPIRIRVSLNTPIKLGKYPVTLDGLLWHCLFLQSQSVEMAQDKLSTLLAEEQGVFKASAVCFGVKADSPLVATHTPTVGVMKPESDLQKDQFHPTGRNGKYSKLQVEGGPFKNRLTSHQTYYASEIFWDAVGDGDAICQLLNFYVLCVGLEANRGFGSVGTFYWEPLDNDTSWFTNSNEPNRILPLPIAKELLSDIAHHEVIQGQLKPPYRGGESIDCIAPSLIRRLAI